MKTLFYVALTMILLLAYTKNVRPGATTTPSDAERGFGTSIAAGVFAPINLLDQVYQEGVGKGCQDFWGDNWSHRTTTDCLGMLIGCGLFVMLVQFVRCEMR